jgi:Secretion system C-terminal sorting domain
MRSIIFFSCLLLLTQAVPAQLFISPGAQLSMTGNAQLTLQNSDLVNNGNFTAGTGTVSFTGNSISSVSGNQPFQFYKLEISKTSASSVMLQKMIGVTHQIGFISGFLNLNSYDVDLGTTGVLNGEKETSRVIGLNGGQLLFSTILNAPAAVNPANLGALITSSQNLGNVIIKRGHQSQINSYGQGNSVLRYFDITPANNNGLNATLRFQYFNGELNGLTESNLVFWRSTDNTHWTNEGFTLRNTTTNYVEKTGIPSFARWTLSSANNPLPVLFTLFNVKCEGSRALLTWKTAQEQNSSHYNVEKSNNGTGWIVAGNVTAAGNSNTEKSYSFTDNNPVQNSYYRIAQYDIDGRVQYTSILRASCNVSDVLNIWPNPFHETVFINISVSTGSQAVIKIFDARGALLKIKTANLLPGSNQLPVEMKDFSGGMYLFAMEWNNGQIRKTLQLVKQ